MSTVRLRRLQSDYDRLRSYAERHPRLKIVEAEGTPPERYRLEYQIRSLRQKEDELLEVKSHLVEVMLPRDYPRTPPQCRMLTPVFHPNIAPHAICIGDHWSAGSPLASIVARIGEMLAYQSYNTKSPLNGEAARWVDNNMDRLPLDPVSMTVDDEPAVGAAPVVAALPHPRPLSRGGERGESATGAQIKAPAPQVGSEAVPAIKPPAAMPKIIHSAPGLSRPPAPPNPAAARAPSPPLPPLPAPIPAPEPAPAATSAGAPSGELKCPQCGSILRVRAELAGKRVRCPRCQTIMLVPEDGLLDL